MVMERVDVAAATVRPLGAGAGSRPMRDSGLGERDLRILEFERQWWRYAGAKEQAIRELFDCSTTRYYQMLNTLIDDPARARAPIRCSSSGCAGCARVASAPARHAGWHRALSRTPRLDRRLGRRCGRRPVSRRRRPG